MAGEGLGVGKVAVIAEEVQAAGMVGGFEFFQEQPLEQPREHGFALITRPFARSVRTAFGDATAWMASTVKRGGIGARIDVPLAHKKAVFVRSHYDTIEAAMPDAPLDGEVVVLLGAANRGRLHARIGGLRKEEVTSGDIYQDRE